MQAPATVGDSGLRSMKDTVDFITHVADCYQSLTKNFPDDLIAILVTHHEELEAELREKIVGSLVLLRRKNIIDSPR